MQDASFLKRAQALEKARLLARQDIETSSMLAKMVQFNHHHSPFVRPMPSGPVYVSSQDPNSSFFNPNHSNASIIVPAPSPEVDGMLELQKKQQAQIKQLTKMVKTLKDSKISQPPAPVIRPKELKPAAKKVRPHTGHLQKTSSKPSRTTQRKTTTISTNASTSPSIRPQTEDLTTSDLNPVPIIDKEPSTSIHNPAPSPLPLPLPRHLPRNGPERLQLLKTIQQSLGIPEQSPSLLPLPVSTTINTSPPHVRTHTRSSSPPRPPTAPPSFVDHGFEDLPDPSPEDLKMELKSLISDAQHGTSSNISRGRRSPQRPAQAYTEKVRQMHNIQNAHDKAVSTILHYAQTANQYAVVPTAPLPPSQHSRRTRPTNYAFQHELAGLIGELSSYVAHMEVPMPTAPRSPSPPLRRRVNSPPRRRSSQDDERRQHEAGRRAFAQLDRAREVQPVGLNADVAAAASDIKKVQGALQPLLEHTEDTFSRMHDAQALHNDQLMGVMASTWGTNVVRNMDAIVDVILRDLFRETAGTLTDLEQQKAKNAGPSSQQAWDLRDQHMHLDSIQRSLRDIEDSRVSVSWSPELPPQPTPSPPLAPAPRPNISSFTLGPLSAASLQSIHEYKKRFDKHLRSTHGFLPGYEEEADPVSLVEGIVEDILGTLMKEATSSLAGMCDAFVDHLVKEEFHVQD